jgi:TolA-binding protein
MAGSGDKGVRDRLSARGEEALGELAQTLLENPVFNQALQAAFGARDAAQQVAHQAFKNAGVASMSDLDRLGRRVRSLSERVEELEDRVDRLSREVAALRGDRSRGLGS